MVGSSKQKLKVLMVMKILLEKTDENHRMGIGDIIRELSFYDIEAERKSIYADIDLLIEFGMDIVCEKGKSNQYYLASRNFEVAELKLLVDSIQASKFITHKKSEELIKKIEKLTSIHEAKGLHRQVTVHNRVKSMNESVYYNIDAIHEAIQSGKMIEFKYYTYDLNKQFSSRRAGEIYTVSPYALSWEGEYYYLIAYYDRYEKITQFRVDRMNQVNVSEKARPTIDALKNFDVVGYTKKVFGMFGGDVETIEIEFENDMINIVIDKFGKEIFIHSKTETHFKITIEVAVTNTFMGWLFICGTKARVTSPAQVVEKVREYVKAIANQYDHFKANS